MKLSSNSFAVIVVGGGHAGAEAALASARLGVKTALISQDISAIARMSCNPAIGGLAKGQIVREVDVLGGIVGLAVGTAIPCIITYFAEMPTVITAKSIFLPFFISVGIGIIFGLYPAASAAKVDPIIALRHE